MLRASLLLCQEGALVCCYAEQSTQQLNHKLISLEGNQQIHPRLTAILHQCWTRNMRPSKHRSHHAQQAVCNAGYEKLGGGFQGACGPAAAEEGGGAVQAAGRHRQAC